MMKHKSMRYGISFTKLTINSTQQAFFTKTWVLVLVLHKLISIIELVPKKLNLEKGVLCEWTNNAPQISIRNNRNQFFLLFCFYFNMKIQRNPSIWNLDYHKAYRNFLFQSSYNKPDADQSNTRLLL